MYEQRIDMKDIFLWKSDVKSSRQDQTQLDGASERRKIVLFSQFFILVSTVF